MADDMDEGGWDEGADGADGGDGWGDAGGEGSWGGDGEEWENEEGAPALGADGELTHAVKIENAYYEADDLRSENPAAAVAHFRKVLQLGRETDQLEDESLAFVFKSMRHLATLHMRLGEREEMNKVYTELLHFIPRVTRNEAQEAVTAILHEAGEQADLQFERQLYEETTDTLRALPDQERLWFRVKMRFCELLFQRNLYSEAQQHLDELLKSCQRPDGTDDMSKGSELLEVYALELRMSNAQQDHSKLQSLYEKTKDLTAAVKDPKIHSIIHECWGQMFGNLGDWPRAFSDFYRAFISYQEVAQREQAKRCLRYVIIANMLSGGDMNPFDAREARAFQNDPGIAAMVSLRQAYEKVDVKKFAQALREINKDGDPFVHKHLSSMQRDFHRRAIKQTLRSYRRIHIRSLAEMLAVEPAYVEDLLVQLILDKEVEGRIDQVNGVLDLTQSSGGGARYSVVTEWARLLGNLQSTLPQPSRFPTALHTLQ